ncbi:MAG: hypothetical protein EXS37_01995 [Opitutus sp.]|nr:hypothetical protein [Opitutus sp.]
MCASPLSFLRSGPPPPKVALLPDALFFTRSVAVTVDAKPAEAAMQVELALEAYSPFPLAQLYYGWFWTPGAERALVFAAYRRRFTSEQTAAWEGAELVLPAFVAAVGADVKRATTIVLTSPDGLTAVHWETPAVPGKVLFRPVDPEASPEDRATARAELLRAFEGSKRVIDLVSPPAPEPARSDREIVFKSGDLVSRLPASVAAAIDVRDKGALAALRNARKRDVILWRVALGCAAALLLLIVGELALSGGGLWQKNRARQYGAQKPVVDKIESTFQLANRIEELATKRLLPLEMVTHLVGEDRDRLPPEILFTRVQADTTRGLYTIFVEGKTTNPAQVNAYETTLKALPACQNVEAKFSQLSGDKATFTLTVTFKPEALTPTGTALVSAR